MYANHQKVSSLFSVVFTNEFVLCMYVMSQFNGVWGQIKTSTRCFAGEAFESAVFVPEVRLAFVILTSSAPGAVLVKCIVGMLASTYEAKARSAQARPPHGTHPIGYGGSPIAVVDTKVSAETDVTRRIKQDGGHAGNHLRLDSDIRRDEWFI